jgi:heme/copper-type cytochrome/quinol oxidase subunit 2
MNEFLQAFALVGIIVFLLYSLIFILLTAVLKFRKKTNTKKYYKRIQKTIN